MSDNPQPVDKIGEHIANEYEIYDLEAVRALWKHAV